MLTRSRGLESDLATLLIAAGAQVCLKFRFKGIFLSARGLFYPSADVRRLESDLATLLIAAGAQVRLESGGMGMGIFIVPGDYFTLVLTRGRSCGLEYDLAVLLIAAGAQNSGVRAFALLQGTY